MSNSHAAAGVPLAQTARRRVGVDFPVQVFSCDFSGALPARARDLSVGGVCIATPSLFSFRSLRRVRLDTASGPIELNAQGRWRCASTSDESVLTGASFVDAERQEVSQLWSVVHDASKELGLFLFGGSELSELCAEDATDLAECSRYRVVPAQRRIYRQHASRSDDDSIFLVLQGEVSLLARLGDRREVTLERLARGCLFGGLPATADSPNLESAVADTQATLLEISAASFSYLRVAKPLLAQRLARAIARSQLRRARNLVELASRSC